MDNLEPKKRRGDLTEISDVALPPFKKGNHFNNMVKVDKYLYYGCSVEKAALIVKNYYRLPLSTMKLSTSSEGMKDVVFTIPVKLLQNYFKYYLYSEDFDTFVIKTHPETDFEIIGSFPCSKIFIKQPDHTLYVYADTGIQIDSDSHCISFNTFMSCPPHLRKDFIKRIAGLSHIQVEGLFISCERTFERKLEEATIAAMKESVHRDHTPSGAQKQIEKLQLSLDERQKNLTVMHPMRVDAALEYLREQPEFRDVIFTEDKLTLYSQTLYSQTPFTNFERIVERVPASVKSIKFIFDFE